MKKAPFGAWAAGLALALAQLHAAQAATQASPPGPAPAAPPLKATVSRG